MIANVGLAVASSTPLAAQSAFIKVVLPAPICPSRVKTRSPLKCAQKAGSVIVDVSIDRGGCFETSEITTHENPVFKKYDVVHYCVPNIPSGFARTASEAISNVLMPLLMEAADDGGFENLVWIKRGVRNGIYLYKGALTNYHLSEKFKLKYTDLELLLAVKG